jgi:hypothetical protein
MSPIPTTSPPQTGPAPTHVLMEGACPCGSVLVVGLSGSVQEEYCRECGYVRASFLSVLGLCEDCGCGLMEDNKVLCDDCSRFKDLTSSE